MFYYVTFYTNFIISYFIIIHLFCVSTYKLCEDRNSVSVMLDTSKGCVATNKIIKSK